MPLILATLAFLFSGAVSAVDNFPAVQNVVEQRLGGTFCYPVDGCTGTDEVPAAGEVLVGQADGTYEPQATSTLGISGGGSSVTFGTDNQVPFTNATGDDFDYSSSLTFDGTDLTIGDISSGNILGSTVLNLASALGSSIALNAGYGGEDGVLQLVQGTLGYYPNGNDAVLAADINGFTVTGDTTITGALDIGLSDGCVESASGILTSTGSACGSGSGGITGSTGQVAYFSGTDTAVGTSTIFIDTNGRVGIGTTSPSDVGFAQGLSLGLNKNIVLSTNQDTDNFRGNIQFWNETNESKSGLEWYDDQGDSIAWIVAHDTNPLGVTGDHHHIEIETADLTGHKQGRFTVGYDCEYDCLATFNQAEVQINRNSGQTNGNLLFSGGGQIRNTAQMQIVPNNALNTKGFRVGTSTDGDIAIDVTSGTELEVLENLAVTGNGLFSGSVGIGTTSPLRKLTVEATGSSGTTAGPMAAFRQNQTSINDTTNSNLGEIYFTGADVAAGEEGLGAKIRAQASNPWNGTANDYPTDLLFFTQVDGGATGLLERMRIRNNGNIGIGTTTPLARLSIHAQAGETLPNLFTIASSTASATTTLFNVSNTGQVAVNGATGLAASTAFQAVGNILVDGTQQFGSASDGRARCTPLVSSNYVCNTVSAHVWQNNSVENMRLTLAGNLGLGSTTPSAKLTVAGGDIHVGGVITSTSTTATSTIPRLTSTDHAITGKLYDANGSAGASGSVPVSTGSGFQWTATSSLGISGSAASAASSSIKVYTATSTWSKPVNLKYVVVKLVGGGGGGAGTTGSSGSGGGGGGGYCEKTIPAASLGSTEAVGVGTGGAGHPTANGAAGASSSFGSHCSATGGGGGQTSRGGAGGIGSGGDLNIGGQGGGGGGTTGVAGGIGGSSQLGGGGEGVKGTGVGGGEGRLYGGGGAAGSSDSSADGSGANGAAGVVIVYEYF
jgi:hypothetical protein